MSAETEDERDYTYFNLRFRGKTLKWEILELPCNFYGWFSKEPRLGAQMIERRIVDEEWYDEWDQVDEETPWNPEAGEEGSRQNVNNTVQYFKNEFSSKEMIEGLHLFLNSLKELDTVSYFGVKQMFCCGRFPLFLFRPYFTRKYFCIVDFRRNLEPIRPKTRKLCQIRWDDSEGGCVEFNEEDHPETMAEMEEGEYDKECTSSIKFNLLLPKPSLGLYCLKDGVAVDDGNMEKGWNEEYECSSLQIFLNLFKMGSVLSTEINPAHSDSLHGFTVSSPELERTSHLNHIDEAEVGSNDCRCEKHERVGKYFSGAGDMEEPRKLFSFPQIVDVPEDGKSDEKEGSEDREAYPFKVEVLLES